MASSSANARVHASILDLYDSGRLAQPMKNGLPTSWVEFDFETKSKLKEISNSSKPIVLLTQTFASPSTEKLISDFKSLGFLFIEEIFVSVKVANIHFSNNHFI